MLPLLLADGRMQLYQARYDENGNRHSGMVQVEPGSEPYRRNLPFVSNPPEQANLSLAEARRPMTPAEQMAAQLNEQLNARAGNPLANRFRD